MAKESIPGRSPRRSKELAALGIGLAFGASACASPRPAPATPASASPPPAPRCDEAARVDVLHHDARLSVDVTPPRLEGRGSVVVRTRAPTRAVRLDAARLAITRAASNGRELPHAATEREICVGLAEPAAAGETVTIELAWRSLGPAPSAPSPAWRDGVVWAGYATPTWMPTVARASSRATLRLVVDAPAGLEVVASGEPEETVARGARIERSFAITRPAPTFLYALAVGPLRAVERQVGGEVIAVYGAPGAPLDRVADVTVETLRLFEEKLGARLPDRRYAEVVVPGDAAQEAVGLALLGDEHVRALEADPQEDWIVSHELAHQWFGRAVACGDFADFWLNEGFASFLVAVAKEARWGREAYDREIAVLRERSRRVTANGKDAPIAPRPGEPRALDPAPGPRGLTYARGALVLHRLREELGDDAFWRGLRRWIADAPAAGARTDDLRRALEAAAGRELGPFFERWIYGVAPDA